MNQLILQGLKGSFTPYHANEFLTETLKTAGFTPLLEEEPWQLSVGGKYYVSRGGTALIAFTVGEGGEYFKIVASHLDSPALKIKGEPVTETFGLSKLNVEGYGGGIYSTFTDVPLKIAGRVVYKKGGEIYSRTYTDPGTYVIPNLAIHMNRKANEGFSYNPQVDLCPLFGKGAPADYFDDLGEKGETVLGYDLFLTNATEPFFSGVKGEFLSSPRIDNQVSAFGSAAALLAAKGEGISLCFFADHEEVGSRTNEGAGSDFLRTTLRRIHAALSKDAAEFDRWISRSFLVSADNAHAVHPNHPELSDPTNRTALGGGIVIKQHANRNYTTDGLTAALFGEIMAKEGVKTQRFFMRSDLRCGSTLGTVSATQVSIPSVDIGVAQLAMHSSLETMAAEDADTLVKGLTAFFNATIEKTEKGYRV